MKNSVKLVQCNRDAYDAVLVERTLESLGGDKADVVVNMEATPRMFQRALMCLKHVRTFPICTLHSFIEIDVN